MGAMAIGVDLGTTSVSAVVAEVGAGVVAARTVPNDAALASTAPGEWTQDPARLVALAEEAVAWARAAH
ncbi:MAG: hypothetical protein LBR27_07910, partial [Bifidobacteriaceae bacterium]|nr:hypothetical protein [Bifidobacteriaceae bacterium]